MYVFVEVKWVCADKTQQQLSANVPWHSRQQTSLWVWHSTDSSQWRESGPNSSTTVLLHFA